MSDDEASAALEIKRGLRLTVTTMVTSPFSDPGSMVTFGPADTDVPDWALEQMGLHCFGFPPDRTRGVRLEVAGRSSYSDGLLSYIDVTCDHGAPMTGLKPYRLARFEISDVADLEAHPPKFVWWWNSALNGPAGPFAERSNVRWRGTGPTVPSFGASRPPDGEPIEISCRFPGCVISINRSWSVVESRGFDRWRAVSKKPVTLLQLRRTIDFK